MLTIWLTPISNTKQERNRECAFPSKGTEFPGEKDNYKSKSEVAALFFNKLWKTNQLLVSYGQQEKTEHKVA